VILSKGELVINYSQPYQSIVLALVPLIGIIGMLVATYFRRRRHRLQMQARVETIHMPHCETIETIAVATNAEALVPETRDLPAPAFAIEPTEEFSEAASSLAPASALLEIEDEYDILELPPIETTEQDHALAHNLDEASRRDCFAAAFIDNPSVLQDAVLDFATT
jgi:hypothetical protein